MNVGASTARIIFVIAVRLPEVPVIVSALVPSVAEPLAARVMMLNPVAGLGANDAVTPLGRPDTERFTLPVNPN